MSTESAHTTLTVADKVAIGQEINSKLTSPFQHPLHNKLSVKTLYSYARKLRKHMPLMESEGRPTLLDADGMAALAEFLINNQGLKVAALRNYIYDLQLKTYCKRRRMSIEDIVKEESPKKMSRRTVIRYVKKLVPTYTI